MIEITCFALLLMEDVLQNGNIGIYLQYSKIPVWSKLPVKVNKKNPKLLQMKD